MWNKGLLCADYCMKGGCLISSKYFILVGCEVHISNFDAFGSCLQLFVITIRNSKKKLAKLFYHASSGSRPGEVFNTILLMF